MESVLKRKKKPLPSVERVKEVFRYDPETGILRKNIQTGTHEDFDIDKPIGTKDKSGYMRTQLDTVKLLVHRIAWVLTYGEWPEKLIDHIDGDPSNNRLNNLRLATHRENQSNKKKLSAKNTSGYQGVSLSSDGSGKWLVFYGRGEHTNGQRYFGEFSTPEEASRKYQEVKNSVMGYFLNPGD